MAAVAVQRPREDVFFPNDLLDESARLLYTVASILNDPICKAREFAYMAEIVHDLNPEAALISIIAQKAFYYLAGTFSLAVSIITTLPAMALRKAAIEIQQQPYMYMQGEGVEKRFVDNQFTLLSWNICGTAAGYCITDGGVLPWEYRIDGIVQKIKESHADVVCLYEVFDTTLSSTFYTRLKAQYPHFYLNIGMRTVGAPSGLFVMSKFPIHNPNFVPFPKEILVGRTKHSEKGVFSFDLRSNGRSFSRIFTTHTQHSEEVNRPTDEERAAREAQMRLITQAMQRTLHCCPILTGDLNFDDEEHENAAWNQLLDRGTRVFSRPTWNGDEYCAELMEKPGSLPCNLDHTMALRDRHCAIVTHNLETGFEGDRLIPNALSDHDGILSTIVV